jgi:hypothetical protein
MEGYGSKRAVLPMMMMILKEAIECQLLTLHDPLPVLLNHLVLFQLKQQG